MQSWVIFLLVFVPTVVVARFMGDHAAATFLAGLIYGVICYAAYILMTYGKEQ